jgi:hypothetical protein
MFDNVGYAQVIVTDDEPIVLLGDLRKYQGYLYLGFNYKPERFGFMDVFLSREDMS